MRLEPKLIAEGWVDYWFGDLDPLEKELSSWATEALTTATENDAFYALEIIDEIHNLVIDPEQVAIFAAGPLEEFLAHQELVVIDEIEKRAANDSRFAHALGGVWRHGMNDETWSRIKQCRDTSKWDDPFD